MHELWLKILHETPETFAIDATREYIKYVKYEGYPDTLEGSKLLKTLIFDDFHNFRAYLALLEVHVGVHSGKMSLQKMTLSPSSEGVVGPAASFVVGKLVTLGNGIVPGCPGALRKLI